MIPPSSVNLNIEFLPIAINPAPPAGLKDEYVRRRQEKGKGKNNFGSYDPDVNRGIVKAFVNP